jgi:3'(2'), 5'-bisphosphate nucleotidase
VDYNQVEAEFRRLCLAGGRAIMEVFDRGDAEVRQKADQSPVTEADEAADAIISAGLALAFPGVTIVTEEQAKSHELTASSFIIVDPLDGTKEFIRRGTDFTVNIALVEDGVPTRGAVYAPARGRMFITGADGRAYEESATRQPMIISPNIRSRISPLPGLR